MWSFLLVFGLLCWGSHGSVTCRDVDNAEVDWYILYKAPKVTDSTTGTEYIYIDSKGKKQLSNINSPSGVLGNTLKPLFKPIRNMESTFGFISYSDQPPGCSAEQGRFGHSKGLVMVDRRTITSTGVWILHSTPRFPFRREENNFWPNSGNKNAQTFICVTFNYDQFSKIGTHLQHISAFPFEYYIPDNFHVELQNVVKWTEDPPTRPDIVHTESLTSRKNQVFRSFAKRTSQEEEDGDLYLSIAENIRSDVYVQTWGCQRDWAESYCPETGWQVINAEGIVVTNRWRWESNVDHSKWCVAKDQNKHWTCIGDMNRAISQYERYGGALCIENEAVHEHFLRFATHPQRCRKRPAPRCDPDYIG
ncbi:plancitoxin-1-like [Anableps anableps]